MPTRSRRLCCLAVLAAGILGARAGLTQQVCNELNGSAGELFQTLGRIDVSGSSAKFWCVDPTNPSDVTTLNKLGANFEIRNPNQVPGWINTMAAGDYDLDGWPDYVGSGTSYSNVLAFVRNLGGDGQVGSFDIGQWIDGSAGDASGWPTGGVQGAAIDAGGHGGMTSGDYDGDGDIDVLYLCSPENGSGFKRIWLYENRLIDGGVRTSLSFRQIDMTSAWSGPLSGIAWSSTMMASVDFDKDGDLDILLGNRDGNVLKLTHTSTLPLSASTFVIEPAPLIATGWTGRGVNTISVADFDGNGGPDVICGGVSSDSLQYYRNDGTGHLTLYTVYSDPLKNRADNLFDGSSTVSLAADFDQDGDPDLVVGTDSWSGTGLGGSVYYFKNTAGDLASQLVLDAQTRTPPTNDLDMGIVLDFDHDGDVDFLIADGGGASTYYLFVNVLAGVYVTNGLAQSTNLTPDLNPGQYAITRVRVTELAQSVLGGSSDGLTVEVWVSNTDGRDWEPYATFTGADISHKADLAWRDFHNFGAKLRWRVVLQAAADSMTEYQDASFETPVVDAIQLEYAYVERREYSRTSAVTSTEVDVAGQTKKLLVAATFVFPGLEGQLRAYDVTGMAVQQASYSTLQTVTRSNWTFPTGRELSAGVTIAWNAGDLLRDRDAGSRTVYCGYRAGGPTSALTRLAFTTANAATLRTLLNEPDGNTAGLINFVRGEGRDWKLGDIQHSNPVVIGPPSENPSLMGTGYESFRDLWENRRKVLYVGANDGMLHCFDAATGGELWAFIPYNLLPKLKNLWPKDSQTGQHYLGSDVYVDGSPSVHDVYINSAWKTVLVCGQGRGKGSSTASGSSNKINFYFALDVTDPANPVPLWEIYQDNNNTGFGETWSVPAFGKVNDSGTDQWMTFMGSGYDNIPGNPILGNKVYVVRVDTGAVIRNRSVSDVNTNSNPFPAAKRYTNIVVTIPGSPTAADTDQNGLTDAVYIGDLDGRMWKLDLTGSNPSNWDLAAVYTDQYNYPIITKPVVWFPMTAGLAVPHVYFGTGGDDAAPDNRTYSFISLIDTGTAEVEWYVGDPTELNLPSTKQVASLGAGEKVWADPVVADSIVYFSTLKGDIEDVNPCVNLAGGTGSLYARYVQSVLGGILGGSALKSASGTVESLALVSKARRAVTIGERQRAQGTYKREVYIQEYDSTIERLEQPVGALLKVLTWREIYKIIR